MVRLGCLSASFCGLRSRSGRHEWLRRKGHSFIGYFLLSLLFFPLALIMAYAVSDRRPDYGRHSSLEP